MSEQVNNAGEVEAFEMVWADNHHLFPAIVKIDAREMWRWAWKARGEQDAARIAELVADRDYWKQAYTDSINAHAETLAELAALRQASQVGEPVATATAKRIEWAETTPPGQWDDTRYGFTITHDQDEDEGYRYHASWGEGPEDSFATLEEAQQWCQEQADDLVRDWAIVDAAPPAVSANKVPDEAIMQAKREALLEAAESFANERVMVLNPLSECAEARATATRACIASTANKLRRMAKEYAAAPKPGEQP